ncbi:MAG TPA: M14 family zinc carboxypeptidase, partial [Gemmatimonadaceae bacterium]|nr:M14 family zinc carboxypeptidase [Gemmatimonadaceae bacterium]
RMMRLAALVLLAAALARPARAQPAYSDGAAGYDPAVPTPRAVLGYDVGDRFTPHHLLMRYVERLAAASPRLRVDTVARTVEGRELLLIAITGDANRARLEEIRRDAARLADPRGATAAEMDALVRRTPGIVWLGYTVHGGEASGTEAAVALLYQLAAGRDAGTRLILDSLVVLVDPVQNPDGHERHVQDVLRARGALGVPTSPAAMIHQGTWPGARTSHYYFDLNRDWFIQSHPETRGRVGAFLRWWPHVAVDLHEMGPNSTYFFAPPMEPVNENVPPSTFKWWDIFAAGIGAAFDQRGWSYFRREGYDEFYPGYGVSWPILTGATGATFEEASSAGGAIRRSDGTVLTLRDATTRHYTAAWATLLTAARHRGERVRDYAEARREAPAGATRGGVRAIVMERDGQGRADSLVRLLARNGIAVHRTRAAGEARGAAAYGGGAPARWSAGAYVVDLAQPQGRLARALLEPDARLDSAFIRQELESRRTGPADRFYDVTAWSLPYAYRVRAWTAASLPAGLEAVDTASFEERTTVLSTTPYGYAFAPGSESSIRLLASLLADSVRVWYAPRAFRSGKNHFPHGAFVVRTIANDDSLHHRVLRYSAAAGASVAELTSAMVDEGTDLGSNSVFFVRPPRVALLGGAPVQGNSFGFSWFAFDQRIGYPVTPVDVNAVAGGALEGFDVLVVPSVSAPALDRALGDGGRERIADWVRRGGALIALDGATAWLASERLGLARLRPKRDTASTEGGAPLPVSVPGAIVRATVDTLSPLLAGVRDVELPVLVASDRVYAAPADLRAGEAVVRYAPLARLRLAGYLWPEAPARLAGTPYLWTERVGRGRVIGFAGDPNFRDLWRGLLPLFANAVFFGASW